MLRFLLDENTDPAITEGLRRRDPALIAWRVSDPGVPTLGTSDPAILLWCEQHNYVLVTNNRHSMPPHLRGHLLAGRHMPGIFTMDSRLNYGAIIDLLILASQIVEPEECRDEIKHLLSV